MKLSKKIMILSLFLVIVCCIGSASATEDVSDNIEISDDDVSLEEVNSEEIDVEENLNENTNDNLGASDNEKLGDSEIYVNPGDNVGIAVNNLDENGVIHVSNGEYTISAAAFRFKDKNMTVTGEGDSVIFKATSALKIGSKVSDKDSSITFKNIIFKSSKIANFYGNLNFENCTFVGFSFTSDTGLGQYDSLPDKVSYQNFTNCCFRDYDVEESCFKITDFFQCNINNCNFTNITSDSIVLSSCSAGNGGINISNSKFSNVTTNGVIDVEKENCSTFENNIGDVNPYRVLPEDSKITITATRDSLTLILEDHEGNIIKNAPIIITAPSHDPNFKIIVNTNDKGIAVYDLAGSDWNVWCAEYEGLKSRAQSYGVAEASVNLRTLAKTLNVQFTNVTDVTGKTMLVVTVKNNLSEAVPNTNFTFTLNGKDYNATTDANGQFIASGLTGDVSVGVKYNGTEYNALDATSNFTFPKTESEDNTPSGNTTPTNTTPSDDKKPSQPNTPAKKVTPVATKITAKKATFKAKKKAKKYSITLKAGKKAVAKVKVTIKVGKKTFKATTNKKGKAIFNLKKLTKKGKYNAVIKFAGNKNYKATSKKVKIVVK
ncbi:hypothetical protein [uncultured Methanobrevibacter sp.]|uniref:hypothetical protein n=1 Tax=uncultured Methanobrevibacter sp. TaxID=253161 RepID=UPI0025D271E2|nr:hypothetical protein [uncultured Methanobrevibacter sp.]